MRRSLVVAAVVGMLFGLVENTGVPAQPAGGRKIKVLVYGGGVIHDFRGVNEAAMEILGACPKLELISVLDTVEPAPPAAPGEKPARPIVHSNLDAMLAKLPEADVLFFHHTGGTLTDAQEAALCGAIASGKGFVGIHSATDSFKQNAKYMEMIGGMFRGHPPYGDIHVEVHQPEHPIMRGLPRSFDIRDEQYLMTYDAAKLNVLCDAPFTRMEYKEVIEKKGGKEVKRRVATGKVAESGRMPAVWTRTWEKGRVAYISFCHDAKATRQEPVAKILLQAVLWAAE